MIGYFLSENLVSSTLVQHKYRNALFLDFFFFFLDSIL